jgi:Zn-dependent peptidase ImmA (M78 family)
MKIAGIEYEVLYLPTDEMKGNIGLADFNKQKIMINSDSTIQTQRIAVVHEVLHILDHAYNLKLSEEQVTFTAHAIVALIADNPELKKYL